MWGVEISEESVACAIENAELNGITNAAFFAGNVVARARGAARARRHARTSSSSTRRARASPARRCAGWRACEAPRIVYVSCNPTTLASDLKALREDFGYELAAAARWTCSRTRRTSRASTCSSWSSPTGRRTGAP